MMQIGNWSFSYPGYESIACTVPCSMYTVLYENGKIPDPFYGLNEKELQHLSDRDCSFETVFTADDTLLSREFIELTFHGLDTLCHIYLNGKLLDKVQNMHREYVYDVKSLLCPGENSLRLDFKSPTQYFAQQDSKHFLFSPDHNLDGSAHLRKALYQSGWDWGPKLPDMGIFRPVELKGYDTDRIEDIAIRQHHKDGSVSLELTVSTRHGSDCQVYAVFDGKRVLLEDGCGVIPVENPRLWWVRGYGEQPLYDLDIELVHSGRVIDSKSKRIGLRTLTVSTQKDADGSGSEFCFVINGVKIFSMGANFIPMDNLLGRITDRRWEEAVLQAIDANFNTLRVWGGGYYPDDIFFDLCDQYGILVWQDFMVACSNIWLTRQMEEEFIQEAACNLKRLHHHACLGILAGNNEMEDGVQNWGFWDNQQIRMDYLRLYERLLPDLCEQYAPQTFYWPSSPSSGGGFEDTANLAKGDTHYWDVWHGGASFTSYREHRIRFCSEYGFESFPSMKTVATFCQEEDCNCLSEVMENHQKCKNGNGKILTYLSETYLCPSKFEDLVYASQLMQADAVRYGVEHFRRDRGYCMGSLYWQFNDCWPVASWSSVDSCGRYKALHYAARKFYAPVAMGLFLENGRLTVNVSNETMADFRGQIRLSLRCNDFTLLDSVSQAVSVDSLSSADVLTYRVPETDKRRTYLAAELYDADGKLIMRQAELQLPSKHYRWQKPNVQLAFRDIQEGVEISVTSDAFTAGTAIDFTGIDCVLSDNFFPLTDGGPYKVIAKTDRTAQELQAAAFVKTVYDIR